MFTKSIVTKLWLAIVSILVITLIIAGFGLFQIVDKFYYSQITKNITYQGKQIASLYENYPSTFKDTEELNRFSHIINAHTIILNEKGIIQVCNSSTHLSPGTVFKEEELSKIFRGDTIVKRDYYEHFGDQMLVVGIPVQTGSLISEALMIYTPVEPISNTVNSLRTLLITTTLGFIILASVFAFYLSRYLSRPLIRMNQVALSLAQGDFSQRVAINRDDEIGLLGSSLNHLSSELNQSITALSLEKEKVENIVKGMSDGIITIDTQGKVILFNPQAKKLLGHTLKIENNSLFEDNFKLGELIDLYKQVIKTRQYTCGELMVEDKTILARLSPLYELNTRNFNGLIIVLQDITKERKLENMRRDFIANVSHELRTPITLIQGYSEAMIDIADTPEQQEIFIKTISEESNRLKRLVEELLELSRLDAGAIHLEKELLDVNPIFEQMKRKFESAIRENAIDFHYGADPNATTLWADRFRFEQILINLIDNAIRYAPGGSVMISSRKTDEGIEISVSDTGEGIPIEDLPYVFERFYRADKSRNRESGGTGLGLSIVKNLVEVHHGKIRVESQPGRRTDFIIVFPNQASLVSADKA